MVVALALLVLLLGVVAVVMFGVLVEFQRQISQLRHYLRLEDDAHPVSFDPAVDLRSLDLPGLGHVDGESRAAVLVLSDHCSTCYEIAAGLPRRLPDGFIVLIKTASVADAVGWLAGHALALGPNIVFDKDGVTSDRLGVIATPAVVKFEGPTAVTAATVPSLRQLQTVIDWLDHRKVENAVLR
jgi:hypothetical protein